MYSNVGGNSTVLEYLLITCLAEPNSIFDKHESPEQGGTVVVIFDVAF